MTSDKLCIKIKSKRSKSFKKHLEDTHPSTMGKISIRKMKSTNPRKQVREMLRFAPNFKKNAKDFTKSI